MPRDQATASEKTEISPDDLALVDPDRLDADATDEAEAWAEFEKAEGAAGGDDGETPDDDEDDDAVGDDAGDDDEGEASDQPTRADSGHQQQGQDRQADGPAPTDPAFWQGLSDTQRREIDRLRLEAQRQEQAARSNAGRVSVLQRQINQFQQAAQRQDGQQQQGAGRAADKAAATTAGQQAGAAANSLTASPEFKKFVEEYPEIGGPMAKVIEQMSTALDQQGRFLASISQERQSQAIAAQEQALAQEHPDWEQVTSDPAFVNFVYAQPRHIQQAVQRNADQIVDAREAGDVIARFKAASGRAAPPAQPPASTAPAKSAGGEQPRSTRRQRQLESAQAVSTRGPGVSSAPTTDDEAALWKQLEREGL